MKRHVVISGTWKLFPVTQGHPRSRVSHSPSTQAPAPRHPQASLSFSGSLACTKIFIPSLPFTALSRAGVNFASLSSLLLPTLFRIHLSIRPAKSFLTHRPGQQLLLLDFALALGISLSIHPTAARPASVHSTLIPYHIRSQTLYHTFSSL